MAILGETKKINIVYMVFEDGYEYGLTKSEIDRAWDNLKLNTNFKFTSEKTWEYNCVIWALNRDDYWKDFFYSDDGYINPDQSVNPYIGFYKDNGFELCKNDEFEKGFEKICIYSKNGIFSHVSRQLNDGTWASKIGNYEDIEHSTVFDVNGLGYGSPEVYMKRKVYYEAE